MSGGFRSIAEYAVARATHASTRTAFVEVHEGRLLHASWSDVAHWAYALVDIIDRFNLPVGSHVATVLPNGAEWIAVDLACQFLGMVHVTIDARLPPPTMVRQIEHSESKICFTQENIREKLPSFHQRVPCVTLCCEIPGRLSQSPDYSFTFADATHDRSIVRPNSRIGPIHSPSPAMLMYTSGTTGQERGVLLSHANLLTNAIAKLDAAPQTEDDIRLNILPFSHAYARTCELSTWIISGGTLSIATNWQDFLQRAPILQPTLVNLVPYLVSKLASLCADAFTATPSAEQAKKILGNRLRLLQVGGAALPRRLWNQFSDIGLPPLQGYGLTETAPVICSNRSGVQQPDTVGPAVQGVEVKIDSDGVLWTRGPHVMLGYWRDNSATNERIKHGWLNTGDLAEQLANGYYRIVGRLTDQIILSTGYKVSPLCIENILMRDEWVQQVVVIGTGQPYISALVWPNWHAVPLQHRHPSHLTPLLIKRIRDQLSDFPRHSIPESLTIIDGEFPSHCLTAKGSVRRHELLETLVQQNST